MGKPQTPAPFALVALVLIVIGSINSQKTDQKSEELSAQLQEVSTMTVRRVVS